MGKDKLRKFAEMEILPNVVQPSMDQATGEEAFELRGKWNNSFFKNSNPIILELGCGKGEYTVGLSRRYPMCNFIGVDIKGARMWRGAKTCITDGIENAGFLRTRIEFIGAFFSEKEVQEIWITFPDPQLKERRTKKRLTSPQFLDQYRKFLSPNGVIHLKTDSKELHDYTLEVIHSLGLPLLDSTSDLYASLQSGDSGRTEAASIQTFYESRYREQGKPITYIRFRLS